MSIWSALRSLFTEPEGPWKDEGRGRRECRCCGRQEVLWGNQFADGFVPDYWSGNEVRPGQSSWHKENTDARRPRDAYLHQCLDILGIH